MTSSSGRATFVRFAIVACTIAGIDIGALYGLHEGGHINVYASRAVSYFLAITAGYFLNRHFTFHHHRRFRKVIDDLLRFYSVFAVGGLLNYGVFVAVLGVGQQLELNPFETFWLPFVGVWIGGVIGMTFNFFYSHKLVFQAP